MKTTVMKRSLALLAALVAALVLFGAALGESYSSSTMRLLHYEGEVEILDASGSSRFVMENVRFSSGESMRTGAGTASVSLDATKIVTLDAQSCVKFDQKGSNMVLTLSSGALFLDVQEKMSDNESLDIQTSNMTVGIRGTIIYVSSEPITTEDGSGIASTLGVLEGTAQLSYEDNSGAQKSVPVPAGNKATVISVEKAPEGAAPGLLPARQGSGEPEISELTKEDIAGFTMEQLEKDEVAFRRAAEANEFLFGTDSDWTWSGTVTLVAQSASKLFDGQPLTRTSDVLVYGLPPSCSIRVSATGRRVDAGESENPVGNYTIYNAKGENITSHFIDVQKVSGQLVVDPLPLTIWTGSAEKEYDGTPLTNPEVGLSSVPGYEKRWTPWHNTSYVATGTFGSQTLYALCGSVWVHGTNPLTGETREIVLRVGQKMQVRLNEGENIESSIELRIEEVSEADLPVDILRVYADNPSLMAEACAQAGWDAELIAARIALLPESADRTLVEKNGLMVEEMSSENLMRDSTDVRITVDSDITDYSGRALHAEEAHFAEVAIDNSIVVTATGSQTEVGSSPNTYSIDWGNANPKNYVVSEELGTLTVYRTIHDESVELRASSSRKVYDGTALTDNGVSVSGLPDGYTIETSTSGSRTKAGSTTNRVEDYTIYDEEGNDVTEKFTNVTLHDGTLTIDPLKLNVDLGGTSTDYTGSDFVPEPTLSYANGSHAGETVSGTRLRAMDVVYQFSLFTGDDVTLTLTGGGSGAGTHTINAEFSYSGDASSFSASTSNASYTINPVPLMISSGSASKPYDGEALTCEDVAIDGLVGGDEIKVTATGSQTAVGTSDNSFGIDWGDVDSANYTLTEETGTLEVTANDAEIVVTAGSASKGFDNEDLTNGDYEVKGLPDAFSLIAETSGSQRMIGESDNTIASYTIYDAEENDVTSNFSNVTLQPGTLEVTTNDTPITVTANSFTEVYSGYASGGWYGVTVEGVPAGVAYNSDPEIYYRDVGSYTLHPFIELYDPETMDDLSGCFSSITIVDGTLEVTPAALTITTGGAEKEYNGAALTSAEITVEGLVGEDEGGVTVETTGAQTKVGETDNTYSIDWGAVDSGNYTLTETLGKLKVTANTTPITITSGSASKVFDNTALTSDECTVEGLPDGFSCVAETSGSQTDAGESDNAISGYTIYDGDEEDVTDCFSDVTTSAGKLTVEKLMIGANARTDNSFAYDGKIHTINFSFCVGNASPYSYPTPVDQGDGHYRVTLDWGDVIDIEMARKEKNPGKYSWFDDNNKWVYVTIVSGNADNYRIANGGGGGIYLIITASVTIDAGGYETEFNAYPHQIYTMKATFADGTVQTGTREDVYENYGDMYPASSKFTFTLPGGETLVLEVGTWREVGTYTYTPTATFSANSDLYGLTYTNNTLIINEKTGYGPEITG